MTQTQPNLAHLWERAGFRPNEPQQKAIRHVRGPLYLPAGPGAGKTRVLLWRTLNLIVYHHVKPEEIFLATFTEKAALQLREGLQALLDMVAELNGQAYDLAPLYVGTVHSLCRRIVGDRRFYTARQRPRPPQLLDELAQYFHLFRNRRWQSLTAGVGLPDAAQANLEIYRVFDPAYQYVSASKHKAVTACIELFNRLSEECIDPAGALEQLQAGRPDLAAYCAQWGIAPDGLALLFELYAGYRRSLAAEPIHACTDFALLQQAAYQALCACPAAEGVFRHVIVDEYQDTNTIQERLFFKLAAGHKNLCVVGDDASLRNDDQALYRFRGATVENFVEFPQRCQRALGVAPKTIPLTYNYRSRRPIVDFYNDFMQRWDWQKDGQPQAAYRVPKTIQAARAEAGPAVLVSTPGPPEAAYAEIAGLVRRILAEGKVQDPNQIAFLFPSLKYQGEMNPQVQRMKEALEAEGLRVYAPRARRFLEVDEAKDLVGCLVHVFGMPALKPNLKGDYGQFCQWLDNAKARGEALLQADPNLARYVADRQAEISAIQADYQVLMRTLQANRWPLTAAYDVNVMKRKLIQSPGLSQRAQAALGGYFDRLVRQRIAAGRPLNLGYAVTRATSLDWSVLDLFYRLCGFAHFQAMFDLAESGRDEGPICNLALLSQYLARFVAEYAGLITAEVLQDGLFKGLLFTSFLLSLFRLSESEYEDAQDPFPKGRIPFLTIHQAKGLEFPVVVLGNPRRNEHDPRRVDLFVRPFLDQPPGEPLDRMDGFDTMRLFYVAISRAQNLLILPHFKGQGQRINEPFKTMLADQVTRIPDFDLDTLPVAAELEDDLPRVYSYTGDYLQYKKCPRQYMIFEKYGFVPSRSQVQFFGNLVHQTLDDLHNYLIERKAAHA